MTKNNLDFDCVVVHYDEIGLKGDNRSYFEKLLIRNIKTKMGTLFKSYVREFGQIIIYHDTSKVAKVRDVLLRVPGIANFSFAKSCSLKYEQIYRYYYYAPYIQ